LLTERMGAGLDVTKKLTPYDSMFAPRALVTKHIQDSNLEGEEKEVAERKIERWFVGAAISERYADGVHGKQQKDCQDVIDWISSGSDFEPKWLTTTIVSPSLKIASPTGAIGKLVKCILNRNRPIDPVRKIKIGYWKDETFPQVHHIWPKQFCLNNLEGWIKERHKSNVALNTMFLHPDTNRDWHKLDPLNQFQQIETSLGNEHDISENYRKAIISSDALSVIKKPQKTVKDFEDFIDKRFDALSLVLSQWGFSRDEGELSAEE